MSKRFEYETFETKQLDDKIAKIKVNISCESKNKVKDKTANNKIETKNDKIGFVKIAKSIVKAIKGIR